MTAGIRSTSVRYLFSACRNRSSARLRSVISWLVSKTKNGILLLLATTWRLSTTMRLPSRVCWTSSPSQCPSVCILRLFQQGSLLLYLFLCPHSLCNVPGIDHELAHSLIMEQVAADRLHVAPGTILMAKSVPY